MATWELTPEQVFLDTMEDLRRRSDLRASEYDMTQSAGLVRRLLMDEKPLALTVNRTFKLKLEFQVGSMFVLMPATEKRVWVKGPWLDPRLAEMQRRRNLASLAPDVPPPEGSERPPIATLTRDRFLASPVALFQEDVNVPEQKGSVADLIRLYANQYGGVHWDMERKPNDLLVKVAGKSEPFLRESMIAVGRIVYRALEPLADTVVLIGRPHPFGFDLSRFGGDRD